MWGFIGILQRPTFLYFHWISSRMFMRIDFNLMGIWWVFVECKPAPKYRQNRPEKISTSKMGLKILWRSHSNPQVNHHFSSSISICRLIFRHKGPCTYLAEMQWYSAGPIDTNWQSPTMRNFVGIEVMVDSCSKIMIAQSDWRQYHGQFFWRSGLAKSRSWTCKVQPRRVDGGMLWI